jgi:hypothetical protein
LWFTLFVGLNLTQSGPTTLLADSESTPNGLDTVAAYYSGFHCLIAHRRAGTPRREFGWPGKFHQ